MLFKCVLLWYVEMQKDERFELCLYLQIRYFLILKVYALSHGDVLKITYLYLGMECIPYSGVEERRNLSPTLNAACLQIAVSVALVIWMIRERKFVCRQCSLPAVLMSDNKAQIVLILLTFLLAFSVWQSVTMNC